MKNFRNKSDDFLVSSAADDGFGLLREDTTGRRQWMACRLIEFDSYSCLVFFSTTVERRLNPV